MSTQPAWHVPEWTMGDRLRKAREDAGLSQAELALAIGCNRNTIGNAELGERKPLDVILTRWAEETSVPVMWLREGRVGTPPTPPRRRTQAGRKRTDTELMQYRYHFPNSGQMPAPLKASA